MKQKLVLFILLLTLLGANHASAHNFFVNITESMAHPPGSIVANIGWGHAMPMDDFLQGDMLDTYAIYDPGLKKMDFPFSPDTNKAAGGNEGKSTANFPGGKMLAGDAYARKVLFNENSPQGTYQIAASIKKTQFAVWTDQQGREKWGRKTLDQIKDALEQLTRKGRRNVADYAVFDIGGTAIKYGVTDGGGCFREKARSILVTSFTTAAGAVPLYLFGGDSFSRGLSFFMIFGIVDALVVSFVLFPGCMARSLKKSHFGGMV